MTAASRAPSPWVAPPQCPLTTPCGPSDPRHNRARRLRAGRLGRTTPEGLYRMMMITRPTVAIVRSSPIRPTDDDHPAPSRSASPTGQRHPDRRRSGTLWRPVPTGSGVGSGSHRGTYFSPTFFGQCSVQPFNWRHALLMLAFVPVVGIFAALLWSPSILGILLMGWTAFVLTRKLEPRQKPPRK